MHKPPTTQTTTHSWIVRVYWEDTDAGGVVFYVNYLKFFERARTEWLRNLGIGQQQLRQQYQGMFVVSQSTVKYLRPACLDDVLTIKTQVLKAGGASLLLAQCALLHVTEKKTPPPLLCEGTIRIAWVNAKTMHPCRIPSHVLHNIQQKIQLADNP